MRSVSSLWTLPIWSFQSVRRTVPVSSPTVASTSFLASPNFDVISLSSLRLTTLTKTFTCLEAGVKSLTFVIALSSMFSLLPTQDARVAKAGKTVSSRIQTLWADSRLRAPPIKTFGSGGAQHVTGRIGAGLERTPPVSAPSFYRDSTFLLGLMLVDAFGREVTDIRVSVTKRCNFGCIYCHDEGLGPILKPRMPHEDEMSVVEIERLLRVAREFGIRSVKFTGGEPLIRLDMEQIIDRSVRQLPDVSMTTNGSMLAKRAEGLRDAGLKRVNVSIDSLDPAAFRDIRKGELAPVLRGIQEALRVGLKPVKLNMVVFKQTLPHIPRMIQYISDGDGLKLQLIQFMPELVGQEDWMDDIDRLKKWLESRADKVLVREMHHRRIYLFNGAEVEVVGPVYNAEFCMNCHRIRVTHQGELKGCLNRNDDLIPTRGLDDDGLRAAFQNVVANRVPYYGAYVKEFPRRDPRTAVPIEFPGVPAG